MNSLPPPTEKIMSSNDLTKKVDAIESINEAITQLNNKMKDLKQAKKKLETELDDYLTRVNQRSIELNNGYTIEQFEGTKTESVSEKYLDNYLSSKFGKDRARALVSDLYAARQTQTVMKFRIKKATASKKRKRKNDDGDGDANDDE